MQKVKDKRRITRNGILWIYKKIWSVFLKKHLLNASLKNTLNVFLNFQKGFSKYYQPSIFYLKNVFKCF